MAMPAPSRSIESVSPFRRSPEARDPVATRVEGTIPPWLRGTLVRTCPAVFALDGWRADHWFDGLAMLYAFHVGERDSVAFRSRLLETHALADASKGRARLAAFGTPMVRPLWKRVFQPVPPITDNANVNVVKMGADLVAMTESPQQILVDTETLAAHGVVPYEDGLAGAVMTAHPQFDFERERVVNVATHLGPSATLCLYEHAPSSRTRRVVASWRASEAPYVHSFGLTPTRAILVAHPMLVKPMRLLWSNRGFIEHFSWKPERGTRLVVMHRATGATREHVVDPFFCFHTVNAFDRGETCVVDLLAYPNADIVETLRVDRLIERLPDIRPSLVRVSMTPGEERARVERLTDVGFEFPCTNYRRVNGKPYRFAWGASNGPGPAGYCSSIVKVDLQSGASTAFTAEDYVFGEPVFVPKPDATSEDDGVLLSVGTKQTADVSALVVLEGKGLGLVAKAEVPRAIPLGFHGSFLRDRGTVA